MLLLLLEVVKEHGLLLLLLLLTTGPEQDPDNEREQGLGPEQEPGKGPLRGPEQAPPEHGPPTILHGPMQETGIGLPLHEPGNEPIQDGGIAPEQELITGPPHDEKTEPPVVWIGPVGLRPEVTVVGQEDEDEIELLVQDVEDDDDDGVVLFPVTEHGPSSD